MSDFGGIHHAADGIRAWTALGVVLRFERFRCQSVTFGAHLEHAGSTFRAGDAGVDAVDGDAVAAELGRQGFAEMYERRITGTA